MPAATTQVLIVGAGPAGLLLGWALRRAGIDAVIVENRSRDHVLARIRAGVLEQGSVEILTDLGLGNRIETDGLVHEGIYLNFAGRRHRVDFAALVGRTVTVYGQQEVVRDLVDAHERAGSAIWFDAVDVALSDLESEAPRATFRHGGETIEITADFIVGADGYHGISRASIPEGSAGFYLRDYPYAWLGILAEVAPSTDELIYALHDDGFALHSMRSPRVSRFYLQVDPTEDIENWPDERIWRGLHERLAAPGWTLAEGPILEKSITPMRSFVSSTLEYHRLFLVGDAGHIVPPAGAKGLNSAIADVSLLEAGLIGHFSGSDLMLDSYSGTALARQWRAQQFSEWMTDLLHRAPGRSDAADFAHRSQLGRLDYLTHSIHAQRSLAEQYTGLPL